MDCSKLLCKIECGFSQPYLSNSCAVLLHVESWKAVQQRLGCDWTHQCGKCPSFCAQQSLKERTPKSVVLPHEWLRQGGPNVSFLRDGIKQWFINYFIMVYLVYLFKHRPAQNGIFSLVLCAFLQWKMEPNSRWQRMSLMGYTCS